MYRRFLSIRLQLPLLICLLLLTLITLFGAISYIGVRRASMAIGQDRLRTLTEQLSSSFQLSARTTAAATQVTANKEEIVHYLEKGPRDTLSSAAARKVLQSILEDSSTASVQLLDIQGREIILWAGKGKRGMQQPDASGEVTGQPKDSCWVGKFYQVGDSLYYPIIAMVLKNRKPAGYLLRWRTVRTNPKSLTQLAQLLGSNAALYFGNKDGSLWTDMLRPVAKPPLDSLSLHKIVTYKRPGGSLVIARAMPIAGSQWVILVELSQKLILEAANRFLYWIIGIGVVLIAIGMLVAWLISRNITRPLDRLLYATTAIAGGAYSTPVVVDRKDELGRLAVAFNSMTAQVRHAHDILEKKVQTRTEELEMVNRELEAFSYSVSHDLRAPLRAVSGYAMMLKEDYEATFDEEAKRITGNIITNVKMMGRLIDDLIAFSRLGKREIRRHHIDMKALVGSCVSELSVIWPEGNTRITIGDLPPCEGDEDLLKQVWMNLIGNALKYSSRNPAPRIEIGFGAGDFGMSGGDFGLGADGDFGTGAGGRRAGPAYFVRDNGAGFDMKYANKLFKVFQRLHSQEEFEGTGVGLALVKRIIDKHKGGIWAESSPGKGAVFYFQLPVNNVKQDLYA